MTTSPPPCHNPDSSRSTRSIDETLAQAASPEVIRHLPGKGQPLNLKGYFHAERARDLVETTLTKAPDDLLARRRQIEQLGACSKAAQQVASDDCPPYLCPREVSVLHPADEADIATPVHDYQSRHRQARRRLREVAEAAQTRARALNEQIMLSRHLPGSLQVLSVDADRIKSDFDRSVPPLQSLPASLRPVNHRTGSWWHLLLSGRRGKRR